MKRISKAGAFRRACEAARPAAEAWGAERGMKLVRVIIPAGPLAGGIEIAPGVTTIAQPSQGGLAVYEPEKTDV